MLKKHKTIIFISIIVLIISIISLYKNYLSRDILKKLDSIENCEKIEITYNEDDNNIIITDKEIIKSINEELGLNVFYSRSHNNKIKKCQGELYCTIEFSNLSDGNNILYIYLCNDKLENYNESYYTLIDGNKCLIKLNGYYFKRNQSINLRNILTKEYINTTDTIQ